ETDEHFDARQILAQSTVREKVGAVYLPIEPWTVDERIAVEWIADFDVAVDRSLHADRRRREVRQLDLDRVGIAVRFTAKADFGRAGAPTAFLRMLEAARLKAVDDRAGDRDRPLPLRGAIAVLDPRAAPAETKPARRVAKLFLQIALPNDAVVIV